MEFSQLSESLQRDAVWVVFLNVLLQQAGLPVPAVPTLLLAGSLAVSSSQLANILAAAIVASVIADWMWYLAGRAFGYRVLSCVALCLLSLGIGAAFWQRGAGSALPLAGFELFAVAAALALLTRHRSDRECIALRDDGLTVEHTSGRRVERVAFQPAWVRVEPRHGDRSLIELSGQGRRIAVGRYVRPELRVQLADELRWALRRWRQRAELSASRAASTNTD